MRLSASQVIERPPAEVFRFVATDHFQNHPQVGSGGYRHHQDLPPGRWGSERPRGWSGPTRAGRSRAPWRSPSTSRPAASPRCPVRPVHVARSGEIGAGRAGEHPAGVGDRYPRPWGDPVAAAADEGDLPQDDGREPSGHQGAGGGDRIAHDLTLGWSLEGSRQLGGEPRTPALRLKWCLAAAQAVPPAVPQLPCLTARARCSPLLAGPACTQRVPAGSGPVRSRTPPALRSSATRDRSAGRAHAAR